MIMTAAGDHLWEISDVDYLPELFEKRQKGQYLLLTQHQQTFSNPEHTEFN